jgi:hypothetical protein
MDAKLKLVTHLPLRELWRDNGFTTTSRGRWLTKDDIAELLRIRLVQFVVANVGAPLQWIQLNDCCRFWKNEVNPHLAEDSKAVLDKFPGSYCYFASLWHDGVGATPIVVLEKAH